MAVRLGYDALLLAAIAGRLARAVMQDMRRGVKQPAPPPACCSGSAAAYESASAAG